MNSATTDATTSSIWCNPPPPGTELFTDGSPPPKECAVGDGDDDPDDNHHHHHHHHHNRKRHRSRSRSRHKHRRRHRSSSRSRSRHRRRHHHHHHRKRGRRSRSRHSHRRHRSPYDDEREGRGDEAKNESTNEDVVRMVENDGRDNGDEVEDDENEDEDEENPAEKNAFKNDGSFMEMFKKIQEEKMKAEAAEKVAGNDGFKTVPLFGKRRGGKVLKTGLVQKNKTNSQEDVGDPQDAWTLYMKEVKRYKEACCDDDSKTRLLVK